MFSFLTPLNWLHSWDTYFSVLFDLFYLCSLRSVIHYYGLCVQISDLCPQAQSCPSHLEPGIHLLCAQFYLYAPQESMQDARTQYIIWLFFNHQYFFFLILQSYFSLTFIWGRYWNWKSMRHPRFFFTLSSMPNETSYPANYINSSHISSLGNMLICLQSVFQYLNLECFILIDVLLFHDLTFPKL